MITWFAVKDYQPVTIRFRFCCVLKNGSKHTETSVLLRSLCFVSSVDEGEEGTCVDKRNADVFSYKYQS